jgi:transcriptional regulator with XRE-family HTH domain
MSTSFHQDIDTTIASRVRDRRSAIGMTIDELARASGVSRAMISKIERRDASPTATLLGRLCNALGLPMSAMFATAQEAFPVKRAYDRATWRDPGSGYLRSTVSPDMGPASIVDVVMPPGGDVSYDNIIPMPFEQYIWILEGELEVTYGEEPTQLLTGDCLYVRLDRPTRFRNLSAWKTRYAVFLASGHLPARSTSP